MCSVTRISGHASENNDQYSYLLDRLGILSVTHPQICSANEMQQTQQLIAGIATGFSTEMRTEQYEKMPFHDKVNFIRVFVLTEPICAYLQKIYESNPQIMRSVMHVTKGFLRQDPRYDFAFLALQLFLGDRLAQDHRDIVSKARGAEQLSEIDVERLRLILNSWTYMAIVQESSWGSPSSRFPVNSFLQQFSPAFIEVAHWHAPLETKLKSFLHDENWTSFHDRILHLRYDDYPEVLLRIGPIKNHETISVEEMSAFRALLASQNLACYEGIMHELGQKDMRYLWYQIIAEKPKLLQEAQRFPVCPPNRLKQQNPLRYALEELLGKLPDNFYRLQPRKPLSPFSAVGRAPGKVVRILERFDSEPDDFDLVSKEERILLQKRAELNLRITNILNGAEKVSTGKLEQLKQEEREISARLRQIVSKIPDILSAEDIRTIEQQKKAEEHREKHIDIHVDGIHWNAPHKSQATHIDFSNCEIPGGVSAVLTCETPYGDTRVLAEVIFPLADPILTIPDIQEMYKGGKFHYTMTFSCPPGKEFAIDTTQMVRRFSTDYVNPQLTPDELRMRERAAEILKFRIKRAKKLQKKEEKEKQKMSGRKIQDQTQPIQLSEYEGDMVVLGIILEAFQNDIKPSVSDEGAIVYNLAQHLAQLGKGYILHGDYSRVTVSKGAISPTVDPAIAELLYVLAERDKPPQNDGTPVEPEDQPDPEYLAFRRELQPIFDALNTYRFGTKEKGATNANPFPTLNEHLRQLGANIYMSSDKQTVTLQIRPVLPVSNNRAQVRKQPGNMGIFAHLLSGGSTDMSKVTCTLAYNKNHDTVLRRVHGQKIPLMRDCGGSIPPPSLNSSQRRAIRDLELRLKELLHFYFASAAERAHIIREEHESLDLGKKFQSALEKGQARRLHLAVDNLLDKYSNGVGNLFPPLSRPQITSDVGEMVPLSCPPSDETVYLLYADSAIEFKGEGKKSIDPKQVEETREHRLARLESLRVSPWGRELLRDRVVATLQAIKRDRINVGSPAFEALKSCFTENQWKNKSREKADEALLDKFIQAMKDREVSVAFRRPIVRTPEQHTAILAKIAAKEASATVSQ